MIGRRSKRDEPPPPVTPPAPDARTIEQPVVPSGDAEPSAQVLDELLTFFGVRHGRPAPPASPPEPSRPAAPADDAPAPTSASTRVLGADELAAVSPPPVPASVLVEDDLVPAPTKRSTRRSLREARRDAKREDKRVARHAKEQAKEQTKAAKQAKKAAKGKGSSGGAEVVVGAGAPVESDDYDASVGAVDGGAGVEAVAVEGAAVVKILDDGDLPDALYLEGELEPATGSGRARPVVFIDDKDPATGAIISMDAATSAATSAGRIEPRLRDRRIAVKRAVGRKRLKWAAGLVAVAGVVIGALAVLGSGLFEITSIRVEGAVYSTGDGLDAVLADLEGANVLRTDTAAFEERLEAIPWVADARVTTEFPNGATVEILERQPVLSYQGADGRFRVLDRRGRVLDVTAGQPVDYLLLDVPEGEGPNLEPGAFAPVGYRAAATLVPALSPALRQQVESISSAPDGSDLRLHLASGIEVRFGAAGDLVDKLVRLQTALTDTNPEHLPTTMIDVSTRDIVVN